MIHDCGLVDFPKLGNIWSWRGVRNNEVIRCHLDKAYGNGEWHELFPCSEVEYMAMLGSDHRPILGRFRDLTVKSYKPFIFDRRWVGKTGFQELVTNSWKGVHCRRRMSFTGKIARCRKEISHWRSKNILPGRQKISVLQQTVENCKNSNIIDAAALSEATLDLKQAYLEEEIYWKQKSRNKWLQEGDANTRFFHAQTKQRRARNRITGLLTNDDTWVTTEDDILVEASSYFTELFSSNRTVCPTLVDIEPSISEFDNQSLMRRATLEEIERALFLMDPGKAPGPDGMTALFFQNSWHTIKEDLVVLVNDFLAQGRFEHGLNQTNICLIPKLSRPTRMKDFRPISLCNVGYKIISKVLCLRLQRVLPKLISETQSAFVTGRLISDNILIAQEMFHALRTNEAVKAKYMAIKTDMSKAYDRVEWNFVDALLRRLGFCENWIKCIMYCIMSVEYSVIINGTPRGRIIPNRGLRQGDPLSPYLFILCTEVLIAKLRNAENRNLLTGVSIARTSPPISHLLFADDSLFFCKATKDEASQILRILHEYECISGQQINFDKSSIQFGHLVSDALKLEIHNTLGIVKVGGMDSYLGLPENIGGSKTKIFAFVYEKLRERVSSWSSKFLSKAGKEVLIKSVLTALPTYVMSCFRLPKSIIYKLSSAIANFWWSNSEASRGVHWKQWRQLCKPKSEGGLGFRTLEDFNSALLAKQLWRLIDCPDSLLARVLRGRYYNNSCPITAPLKALPSYGWRSILSARPLVMRGLIRRIGDGKSIRVWKDPWIPDLSPRPATQPAVNIFPNLTLDHFIDHRFGTWKEILVRQYFNDVDAPFILGIPISRHQRPDFWGWHFTKTGRYTVKSGYYNADSFTSLPEGQFGPHFHALYNKIWTLDCPNKIQHFIWQALTGCIAVKQNLSNHGIPGDIRCSRCGCVSETVNHVLFECPPAIQAWALSQIPSAIDVFPGGSVWYNLDYLFWRLADPDVGKIFPWIIWHIWKARNDHCFSNIDTDPRTILLRAEADHTEWSAARGELRFSRASLGVPGSNRTSHLAFPFTANHSFTGYKCRVDASWKSSAHYTGLGWYCFPDSVEGELRGARAIHRSLSALHSEVEAVLWAMESLLELQIREVELSTDSETVLTILDRPEEWPAFRPYQDEFARLCSLFSLFSLSVVPRSLNHKADSLARSIREVACG